MRTSLGIGAFAIVALLVAGISYWAVHQNPQSSPPQSPPPPTHLTEAPSPPIQNLGTSGKSPSAQQAPPSAGSPAPQTTVPPTSAPAPAAASPGPTTSADQSAHPPAPPPNTAQAPQRSPGQTTTSGPATAALATSMPSEDKMSVANRRQVQEALHRLGYYDGPVDGKFGPLTRAAIRRFQDSVGDQSTGYLTATQASRLVSTSG